jgi:hypothetical protein
MNDPLDLDVLLGRGSGANNHYGNVEFRKLVAEHKLEYSHARKLEKPSIAMKIINIVHSRGGRFLKQDEDMKWVEVTKQIARKKTLQALRDEILLKKRRKPSPCTQEQEERPNDSSRFRAQGLYYVPSQYIRTYNGTGIPLSNTTQEGLSHVDDNEETTRSPYSTTTNMTNIPIQGVYILQPIEFVLNP